MKRSATASRTNARLEFAAVVRCALDVCDELHRRGLEDDDRPRLWLDAALRWGLGEKDAGGLAAATRALSAWSDSDFRSWSDDGTRTAWRWMLVLNLKDAREDIARHVTHAPRHVWSTKRAIETVWRELGESGPAAENRVNESFNRHREALVQARLNDRAMAQRASARDARSEAERLLALPLRTGAVP